MTKTPLPTSSLRRAGFTLIELLVVMAISGVLMSIGALNVRPPATRLAADAAMSVVQQARFEAVRSNRPVIVSITAGAVTTRRGTSAIAIDCTADLPALRTLDLGEFRGVGATPTNGVGLVWLPSGQARACPGGAAPLPVAGLEFTLSDASRSQVVHVGPGGEVTLR